MTESQSAQRTFNWYNRTDGLESTEEANRVESSLCPALRGRLEFHAAEYRRSHDQEGRIWVTLDKVEILSCAWERYLVELGAIQRELQPGNQRVRISVCDPLTSIAHERGVFSNHDFWGAAHTMLSTSIQHALQHEEPLVRALAMVDRRLGKRRLCSMNLESENRVVRQFFDVRCQAESLSKRDAT